MEGISPEEFEYYLKRLGIKDGQKITKEKFVNYALKRYSEYYEVESSKE